MVDTTLQPAFESSKENPKSFEPIIRMIILIPILVFSFTDMHTYAHVLGLGGNFNTSKVLFIHLSKV